MDKLACCMVMIGLAVADHLAHMVAAYRMVMVLDLAVAAHLAHKVAVHRMVMVIDLAFAGHMAKLNKGSIALIGSVAGDRGRKSNYVYGAAKGMVALYAQGLQHRFAGTGVHVTLVKPGPTDTPMTAGMKGKFASAEEVAKMITLGIESKIAVIYAPSKWWLIMTVIRHLPSFIFNKLNI